MRKNNHIKLIALVLALVLAFSICTSAFADGVSENTSPAEPVEENIGDDTPSTNDPEPAVLSENDPAEEPISNEPENDSEKKSETRPNFISTDGANDDLDFYDLNDHETTELNLPKLRDLDLSYLAGLNSIAAVAKKELTASDNSEFPKYSDCVKYNTWAREQRVCNAFKHGNYIQKYNWNTAFVSWCANQAGLVSTGIFPKTANGGEMFSWFSERENVTILSKDDMANSADRKMPQRDDLLFFPSDNGYDVAIITAVDGDVLTFVMGDVGGTVAERKFHVVNLPKDTSAVQWGHAIDPLGSYYSFLVNQVHLTPIAAIGVLANIKSESNLNAHALGDSGSSYGLCQWHNYRWMALIDFCNENGFDWTTPEGQMWYLKYELDTYYKSLVYELNHLPNDSDGAYQAAYRFCEVFERPEDVEGAGDRRGCYAEGTLFPTFVLGK